MVLKYRGDLREILEVFGDLPPRWLLHGARHHLAVSLAHAPNEESLKKLELLTDLEEGYKSKDISVSRKRGGKNGKDNSHSGSEKKRSGK
jgi:hypothetical protein